MDFVEHEPAGASHCSDIFREQQGVVQVRAMILCTLGGGHRGIVDCDGEVFELTGLPGRKSTSVLSRLSLRWWANIQAEIAARHASWVYATWVSEGRDHERI